MTELKYLEEVLPAYRAGKTIGRRDFNKAYYYNINAKANDRPVVYTVDVCCAPSAITEKVWFIKPEFVSWPEAWEALKAGKKVKVDGNTIVYELALQPSNHNKVLKTIYDVGQGATTKVRTNLSLDWLDRTDFEVVED